ncbi:hypothetical protein Pla123a_36950 [Posidoniimonas polymericola]|uniref:PEP-CTERM protein-sorting domain-containing protein n=1 Tax=Posidoniimonas polymericola TaxID=2528002 RepID=A0A5C5YGT0_9BACT|nr:hypothetical protein [Posidoniimonas polymericola]TWT73801.1 hypothetical protein Pla123a_36950 [Posidoniimonas polymericola]
MKIATDFVCLAATLWAAAASAQLPPLPPMTNGDANLANNGMKHALVAYAGDALSVHLDAPPASPVTMTSGVGKSYDALFDVLEGKHFNSQHGWLPDGVLVPPAGAEVWIKRTGATTPAGAELHVYEGGMGNAMASWTMNEIYAADGAIWLWDRFMQHDLYVADLPGAYSVSFEVYLGDATTGDPLAGITPATTTFSFVVPAPEPAAAGLLLCGLLPVAAWRRGPDCLERRTTCRKS